MQILTTTTYKTVATMIRAPTKSMVSVIKIKKRKTCVKHLNIFGMGNNPDLRHFNDQNLAVSVNIVVHLSKSLSR